MHLLISEITAVDAVLDWAITWVDSVHDGAGLTLHEIASTASDDCDDSLPGLATSAWYDPRLSELRQALASC
jgi:hypothetical protein